MTLCLFNGDGTETQLVLPERDGDVWHGFVPGVTSGQAYGFRVSGPYDRARGQRYNPAKLLLDPYARAINGDVRFGPELLDYAMDNTDAPSQLDSAGHMPRSLVTAPASKAGIAGAGTRAGRHDPVRSACTRIHREASRRAGRTARHLRRPGA